MKQLKKSYLGVALALSTCAVLFQNCAAAPPPDLSQLSQASIGGGAQSFACNFAGRVLNSGESVEAYQTSSVAAGGTCARQSRTCNNGILSGNFSFASCVVQSPTATASCSFYGQTIPHGGSVAAFQNSSVGSGSSCTSENRICTNGVLSGNYQYSSCSVSCSFNGAVIANGATVTAYQAPSVASGSSCVAETRSCNQGSLTGSFAYSSCSVQAPVPTGTASCSFNGQTILHGASVTAYAAETAPVGTSRVAQNRICSNGTLSGSYAYSYCEREAYDPCNIQEPNFRYQREVVACP